MDEATTKSKQGLATSDWLKLWAFYALLIITSPLIAVYIVLYWLWALLAFAADTLRYGNLHGK